VVSASPNSVGCLLFYKRLAFNTDDLITYFDTLEKEQKLPSIEELETKAWELHHAYSTVKGYDEALYGLQETKSWWLSTVPEGAE
jgi:hypothetical protein